MKPADFSIMHDMIDPLRDIFKSDIDIMEEKDNRKKMKQNLNKNYLSNFLRADSKGRPGKEFKDSFNKHKGKGQKVKVKEMKR